jgi:glycerol uptake facilitator-like aquaporin
MTDKQKATNSAPKKSQQQLNAEKALNAGLYNVQPTGPKECELEQRPQSVNKRRRVSHGMDMDSILCSVAKFVAELFGCMAVAFVLPIRDLFLVAGLADPGFIAAAGMRAAVTIAMMLAMMIFKAGHLNPIYTVMQWCCEQDMWSVKTLVDYFLILLGQFFGYLFGAWIVSAFFAAPLSCTVINPLAGNGFGYLFEAFGQLFLIFAFALAVHRKTSAMTGVLGVAALEFAFVATFAPLTGGSFNFFRSLGVALVLGGTCNDSLGIYVGAMFSAVVVAIVVLMFILRSKYSATDGHEIVVYDPPPIVVKEGQEKDC